LVPYLITKETDIMLLDSNGFSIPFAADDQFIENDPTDPFYGEPASWPTSPEIDGERWAPTETTDEPTEADEPTVDLERLAIKREYEERRLDDAAFIAWCDEQERLDEMAEASRWQDRVEELHQGGDNPSYLSDRDIITATGGCG
jgi:hypothetical protein